MRSAGAAGYKVMSLAFGNRLSAKRFVLINNGTSA